jgi:hypothetical protein
MILKICVRVKHSSLSAGASATKKTCFYKIFLSHTIFMCPHVILKFYTILKMNVRVKHSSLSFSNVNDEEKSFTRLQ